MKAAVLLVRLMKNHALPDGNKRTALAVTIAFCDVNGFDWLPPARDDPDGEQTYQVMLAIAAAPGADLEAVEAEVAAWITERLHQRTQGSRSCGDTCGSSRLGDAREHLPAGCAQAASADPKRPHSPSVISRASAGPADAPMAYALVSEVMDQTCRSRQVRGNRGGSCTLPPDGRPRKHATRRWLAPDCC